MSQPPVSGLAHCVGVFVGFIRLVNVACIRLTAERGVHMETIATLRLQVVIVRQLGKPVSTVTDRLYVCIHFATDVPC